MIRNSYREVWEPIFNKCTAHRLHNKKIWEWWKKKTKKFVLGKMATTPKFKNNPVHKLRNLESKKLLVYMWFGYGLCCDTKILIYKKKKNEKCFG